MIQSLKTSLNILCSVASQGNLSSAFLDILKVLCVRIEVKY